MDIPVNSFFPHKHGIGYRCVVARPRLHPSIPETDFAQWLSAELAARKSNGAKLAAAIDSAPQTVNAWFRAARIPGPDLCARIAGYLHIPVEEVLIKAGHLPADHAYTQPEMPGWLLAALEGLSEADLRVVAATAQGLREVRARYPTDEDLRTGSSR